MEANLVTRRYLTASKQYFQDHLALYLSKKPIPPETSFVYFCNDWYLAVETVIAVFGILLVTYVTQVFEYPRWDWNKLLINGLACFLNSTCTFAPKSICSRIGFISFLFAANMFCINFMARFMIWITQVNYFPQFISFDEIIDDGYYLRGDSFAFAKLTNIHKVRNKMIDYLFSRLIIIDICCFQSISFGLCGSPEECFNYLYSDQNIAVASSTEYFQSVSKDITANIYSVLEDGFSSKHGLNFLLQKDFNLKAELDRFISMANEGGLISKWMADLSLDYIKQHDTINNGVVSITHVISLAIVYIPLMILSLLVFLTEIIIHFHLKTNPKSNARQFWTIAETLIDPERHFLNYDLRFLLPFSYYNKTTLMFTGR